jgi:hypothetical protein
MATTTSVRLRDMLSSLSLEQLAALETEILAQRAERAGEPILVCDRAGAKPCPCGGALLHVRWAVEDCSYDEWYSSTEAANAALEEIAQAEGAVVDRTKEGYACDMTRAGCYESSAWVEPRG